MEKDPFAVNDEQLRVAEELLRQIGITSFLESSAGMVRQNDKAWEMLGSVSVGCFGDFEHGAKKMKLRTIDEIENSFYFGFGFAFSDYSTVDANENLSIAAENLKSSIDRAYQASTSRGLRYTEVVKKFADRGIRRVEGSKMLVQLYEEQASPNSLSSVHYTIGIGLAMDLKSEFEELNAIDDKVSELVPEFSDIGLGSSGTIEGGPPDEMDRRIKEFQEDSAERMRYLESLEEWESYIEKNGLLKSIYTELHRALENSGFRAKNGDAYYERLEDLLLDGFAYGCDVGTRIWDFGSIGMENSALTRTRMKSQKVFEHFGMTKEGHSLYEFYDTEAYQLYEKYVDSIFQEVSEYAQANILTKDGRDVFMMSAGIAIKMYDDADELRTFEAQFSNNE